MYRWLVLLVIAGLPSLTWGQSLGELARREKERRQKIRESGVKTREVTQDEIEGADPTETSADPGSGALPVDRTAPGATSPRLSGRRPAPGFSLEDRDGRRVSLADFRGKPVLLDFWATWCGPCRQSMPEVEKLHRQYSPRGLQVLAINIEGKAPRVLNYLRQGGYSFRVLFDSGDFDAPVAGSYGVDSIPRTVLIDAEGNIVYSGHPGRLSDTLIQQTLR